MKSRLLVAAVGIPILLIILLVCPKLVTAIAVCILCAIAANEILHTTGLVKNPVILAAAEVLAALIPLCCYIYRVIPTDRIQLLFLAVAVLLYLFILVIFLCALRTYPNVEFKAITAAVFAGILIPVSMSGLVRLITMDRGRFLVLIPIIIPFIADAGAYFAGYFFGKHKMAPVLSPKKTMEGAVGGIAAGAISMIIFGLVMRFAFGFSFNYVYAVIYGILGSVISIIGDLSFSMIKRETGIKDYGTIFRAHGGVLDRFDSMIFTLPIIEILLITIPIM